MPGRNPDASIRLAIIGAGAVTADHHLPALRWLPQIKTVALADVDAARLNGVADRFGIPGRFDDPHDLLNDPAIEAVAVCTPPQTHAGLALAALDAGKHVFIEKPMALSLSECAEMQARAASRPGQGTLVGFNLRCHRLMAAARRIILTGTLGNLQTVRVTITSGYRHRLQSPLWRTQRQTGGSVILELGSHAFDLVRFLSGDEFTEVYAVAPIREDLEEIVNLGGRLGKGTPVSLLLGDHTADVLEVDVFGENARLHISGYRFDGLELWPALVFPGSLKVRAQRVIGTMAALPPSWPSLRRGGDFAASYVNEWSRFAACVAGGQPPPATLADGRAALQVALASLYSLREKQPVTLPLTSAMLAEKVL